jgi:hypothetical protein
VLALLLLVLRLVLVLAAPQRMPGVCGCSMPAGACVHGVWWARWQAELRQAKTKVTTIHVVMMTAMQQRQPPAVTQNVEQV